MDFAYHQQPGLAFIEDIFPPIPSVLIVPFGGHLARGGQMNLWLVVLFGTLGATLGSLPLYYTGHAYGEKRLKKWADKYGKWLGVDGKDIPKSKEWSIQHQTFSVFWCRLVPGIARSSRFRRASIRCHCCRFWD